jgi:flagellar M-ring protein FliF
VKWEGTGKNLHRVITPPSQQVLASVKSVVTAAIGLMPERGDVITVETLPFEETLNSQQPEAVNGAPATKQKPNNLLNLPMPVLIGAGVGILLIIGAAVFFMVRKPKRAKAAAEVNESKALPGSADINAIAAARAQAQVEAQSAETSRIPLTGASKTEALVKQLRDTTKKDASAPAQILQTWIHER